MSPLFNLPDEAFVRLPSIIGTADAPGPLPISPSNFWARVADGRLPKPYKLGAGSRVSVWKVGEIRAALDSFKQES